MGQCNRGSQLMGLNNGFKGIQNIAEPAAVVFQLDNSLPWQQYPGGGLPYKKYGGALRKF